MLECAARKYPGRFTWAVTTNGTVLSGEAIGLLAAGEFQVVLSIDGPARVHDECRRTRDGRPTHDQVLGFLHALRARTTCRVRGSAVVRSGWPLSRAVQYLRRLPLDAIKAQAVRGSEGAPGALSPSERDVYLQDLEALGRRVVADLERGQPPKDDRFSARVLQLLAGVRRDRFCAAGDTVFGIAPNGEVLPCVLLSGDDCLLGHVDDDPARWRQAGRQWWESRPLRAECQTCSALPLCGGGCPAILPVCGAEECDLVRKNCEVATAIYQHFRQTPKNLLALAGIT
jgi:uncharacterized protein